MFNTVISYQAKVLEPLGAITTGSQFLEPNGNRACNLKISGSLFWNNPHIFAPGYFPNHIPNPEDKDAMKAITQAVLNNKADLGIIFDTDVDRYSFILS